MCPDFLVASFRKVGIIFCKYNCVGNKKQADAEKKWSAASEASRRGGLARRHEGEAGWPAASEAAAGGPASRQGAKRTGPLEAKHQRAGPQAQREGNQFGTPSRAGASGVAEVGPRRRREVRRDPPADAGRARAPRGSLQWALSEDWGGKFHPVLLNGVRETR